MDSYATTEIVRTLGSLASMVSAYIAIRRENREISSQVKESIIVAGQFTATAGGNSISYNYTQAINVIPHDILEAATGRITSSRERYIKALRSPISIFDLDREKEIAQFEICRLLKLIKEHNRGELPEGEWKNLWIAFSCES